MTKLTAYICGITLVAALMPSHLYASQLPDLGSEFRSMLSVNDERLIGEYYMSQIRASNMLYPDPLVNEYVTYIGNQLTPYIQMPYPNMRVQFFAVQDNSINAFAFFGGHVGIHSGLILLAESESELAGVMAHELAHISQQHILRQMADNKRFMPLTLAGTLAAVLIGAPDLMIPVLAGHMQHSINFTRSHEQEADRIGIKILSQAKFDPQGLSNIFERMSLNLRYQGKPPEYLLTHPLYESRISDTRHRASILSYKKPKYGSNMFDLMKARIAVQTTSNLQQLSDDLLHNLKTQRYQNQVATEYGYAYALFKKGKTKEAWALMDKLAKQHPDDLIIQMTTADMEEQNSQYTNAKARLEKILTLYNDSPSLLIQYTQLLLQTKQPAAAKKVLLRYKSMHAADPNYYELIRQVEGMLGNKVAVYEANAEWYILHGDIDSALKQLDLALANKNNSSKTDKRIKDRQQAIVDLEKNLKSI